MNIDIYIKTYQKDFKWLYYSLLSIEKYVTGYNKIIITMSELDYQHLDKSKIESLKDRIDIHFLNEYGNGYYYQQFAKMTAHKYCKSTYIMYLDSDVLFTDFINLLDLIEDNKPTVLYTKYDDVGSAICWKEPTSSFIGEEQEYEFMRRNGLIYHRTTIEEIYNSYPNLENIIMNCDINIGFSEFNVIGAWAFKYQKDKYNFLNTENGYKNQPIKQFWSYSDLNENDLNEINNILK